MNKSSSSIEDILPLSPMQKGILAHSQRPEAKSTYVIAAHIRWQGKLRANCFEAAWRDLAERHVALRSLFVWEGVREPVAVVTRADKLKMPVKVLDLRANPPSVDNLETRVLRAYEQGFDLSSAPLMRHILVRTADDAWSWIWVHHHLIVDGWCLPILLKEFFDRYQERVQGRSEHSVEVASVRDYIKWARGRSTKDAMAHWQGLLGDLQLPTPLPLDRALDRALDQGSATGPVQAHGVGAVHGALSTAQAQTLRESAAKFGVTINTLFQAAWALTLRAYCGHSSPVFGMTYSGRLGDWPGLAKVVSVCIDTVPFRVDIAPEQTMQAWMGGLLDQAQKAQELAPVGLGEIKGLCQAQPFESIVVFENYPLQGLFEDDDADFHWEVVQPRPGGSLEAQIQERNNFPLTLVVDPGAQSDAPLSWILAYRQARFDRASMQEVSECLLEYLKRIMQASAQTPLVDLLHTVSIPAKRPDSGTERAEDPANWLFRHAKDSPHKLAVVAGDRTLSYAQLAQAVQVASEALRAQGLRVGDRVGVDLRCGAQWMVTIGALLESGAAYVPVDPSWPAARKSQVFDDAQVRFVVRDQAQGQDLRAEPWLDAKLSTQPSVRASIAHPGVLPAYLIYTSGSSGRPKGVVVPREALALYCASLIARLSLDADCSFAFVSSPGSDLGHTSVFAALALGATLHWVGPETALNAQAFGDYNQTHGLDVVKVTPSQLGVWLDCEEPWRVLPDRHLISGGEVLPAFTAQRIFEHARSPKFALWNHYGPTETAVGVCVSKIQDANASPFPIGTPLGHAHCEVVDPQGLGQINRGELWIGGASVAHGYWQRPRETALAFVPDPFSGVPGARVYASGDEVRSLAGGELLFMGRIDEQVSIRGHRVEPLEIEAVLSTHPQLQQVAVVARKAQDEERLQLWAFVICENGSMQLPQGMQSWAAQCLPEAMVPQRFVALERFALLANGKVDKSALAGLPAAVSVPAPACTRPLSELETLLLGVFQEVLAKPEFGVEDNLFAQGGDSIHSLRIAGRIKKMGHALTPQMIFEEPSVAELARRLEGQGSRSDETREAAALDSTPRVAESRAGQGEREASDDSSSAPLLPSQRHFFAQGQPDVSHFNLSFVIELPKPPGDVPKAWNAMVRRHPCLSLRVDEQGQRQGDAPELLLRYAHPHEFPELWTSLQQSLDPRGGPAVKAVWIQGASPMVWMIAHHLVMDVVSARVLQEEFLLLLSGQSLPEPGPTVLDWARRYAQSGNSTDQQEHWAYVTQPLQALAPMPAQTLADTTLRRMVLDKATMQRWSQALDQHKAYRWDTLILSAWAGALMRAGRQRELLIECEGHGRSTEALGLDTSRSVGWFTVRYPIRIDQGTGEAGVLFLAAQKALLATPQGGIGYPRWRDEVTGSAIGTPYFCYNHLGDLGSRPNDLMQLAQRSEQSLRVQWIELTSFVQDGELVIEWRDAPGFAPAGWEQVDLQSCFEDMREGLERCVQARLSGSPLASTAAAAAPIQRKNLVLPAQLEPERARIEEALAGVDPGTVQAVLPCNAVQSGIWTACRRAGDQAAMYWNHSEWELTGVSLAQLRQAFSTLMQRHEVLRSRWIGQGLSTPMMAVLSQAPLPLRSGETLPLVQHAGLPTELGWELCVATGAPDRLRCRWSRHHLLLDGWSHGILFAELVALIEGQSTLDAAPQYSEYLRWLAGQDKGAQASFWRETLAGVEPCVAPPFAESQHGHGGYRSSGYASMELPATLAPDLQKAAQQCAVTVQSLAQGTFALWLSRAWGRPDPVFAVADAGRSVDAAQSMVGMMMRVLPFVMSTQADSVGEYLAQVQRRGAKLRAHGDLGMSKIQSLAHAAQQGLCSVLWVYENYPMASQAPSWIRTESQANHYAVSTDFALVWVVEPGALGQGPRLSVNFDPSIYGQDQIEALMRSYCELLQSLVSTLREQGPAASLAGLALPVQPDHCAYAPSSLQPQSRDTIASRFADMVERYGDCEAMSDAHGSRWTYSELDQEVSRVAAALRARGVGAEQAVGLCLSPDADLVISMMAILRAGGYYVPIDPSTPSARIAEMLHGVKAQWVIVANQDPAYAGDPRCEALSLEQLSQTPLHDAPNDAQMNNKMIRAVHPCQLAYLIYTSGSTGRPKGVGVEHRNAIRLFDVALERMSFGPEDAWSLLHRHAFDFSVWEIFGPLLSGGKLVIVPTCERREPAQLLQRLSKHEVSMLSLTPSALIALQRGILSDATLMGSLRTIVLGGEALDVRHLEPAWHTQDTVALINMYGITETTVHVTSTRVTDKAPPTGSLVGPPLPDLSLAVLDAQGHLLPKGVAGEFFVGGRGVSRGYIGQAALTAQRFVPDPLGEPGSRRYRTGDRGQLDAQGRWRHEGRLDQQVQIRGHRIELGEIEARLLEHPVVQAARVLACPDERALWAYVVTAQSGPIDVPEMRSFLGQWLPDYMVPREIMVVSGFVRTANGKLDRSVLPTPHQGPAKDLPLQGETQERVAQIWSGILERPVQGRNADFFALGGQSMAAMRVCDEVQRCMGKVTPIAKVFELPLLEDFARWLDLAPSAAPAGAPIKKRRRGGSA